MKKIISGYFYRLIRGFEIWILVGLFIASSLFFMIRQTGSNIITRSDDIVIEKDNYVREKEDIRDHCFENLNISAKDLYRYLSEPIPEQSFQIPQVTVEKRQLRTSTSSQGALYPSGRSLARTATQSSPVSMSQSSMRT